MKYILIAVLVIAVLLIVCKKILKKKRREKLVSKKFDEKWLLILKDNMPVYQHLPPPLQKQLQGLINIFIDEKYFEGFEGIEITDDIKVTIAGQACLLLLNRKTSLYKKLHSIYIYPTAYVSQVETFTPEGIGKTERSVRAGESWQGGTVVLSWDDVQRGAYGYQDGSNVTLHEFAHQLDQADGVSDGAPILTKPSQYISWAKILGEEYKILRHKDERGKKTFLDKYGATKPAEFFAVATEFYFEKPNKFYKKHPELYEQLQDFYKVDPREWL